MISCHIILCSIIQMILYYIMSYCIILYIISYYTNDIAVLACFITIKKQQLAEDQIR